MNVHESITTAAERRAYLQGKRAALQLALQDFLDAKRAGTLAENTEGAWRRQIETTEREIDELPAIAHSEPKPRRHQTYDNGKPIHSAAIAEAVSGEPSPYSAVYSYFMGQSSALDVLLEASEGTSDTLLREQIEASHFRARHQLELLDREAEEYVAREGKDVPLQDPVRASPAALRPASEKRHYHFSNPDGVGDWGDTLLGTTAGDTWDRCRNHLDLLSTLLGEHCDGGLNLSENATQALTDTLGSLFAAMHEQIRVIDEHNAEVDRIKHGTAERQS